MYRSGCAVTPRMCTRRVSISITKNILWNAPPSQSTESMFGGKNTVSTCRKLHARIPDAWAARNCRQVGDARRGASRATARIRGIVPARDSTRGRAAHLGYVGAPTVGSAWPAAGPAHGSLPGPAGGAWYSDRSTCSSPGAQCRLA